MRTLQYVMGAGAAIFGMIGLLKPALAADEPSRPSIETKVGPRLPIFDAHIHYAHDAFEIVPPAQLIEHMRKAGLSRALVSGAMTPGSIDDGVSFNWPSSTTSSCMLTRIAMPSSGSSSTTPRFAFFGQVAVSPHRK